MSKNLLLRLVALALLLPGGTGCIYSRYRTLAAPEPEAAAGRPFAWSAAEKGHVYRERVTTEYRRRSIYPVDFRYLTGEKAVLEPVLRIPTWLFEMPLAWDRETAYEIAVIDHTPRAEAVRVRALPYYALPPRERYGTNVSRSFADPMFIAYRRLFEKEVDFSKGDEAMAAKKGGYAPHRLYERIYERWLADHVPMLAWEDAEGGEHLILRRTRGFDHYRDLKLVRHVSIDLAPDAVLDTVDGENIYVFSHGWAENRYFLAIPTSRKGAPIVSRVNLASGERQDFGHYGDRPEALELPKELELKIVEKPLDYRGLCSCRLW